jgi:hypothetical protein
VEAVRASLRAKLALVLVVAIVAVVGLATTVTTILVGSPGPPQIMDPIAHQIRLNSDLAGKNGGAAAAGLVFDQAPAPGPISPHFTESLRDALDRTGGDPLPVVVTRPEHRPGPGPGPAMTISIPVPGRGWLIMPLQELPPPGPPWPMLVGYMGADHRRRHSGGPVRRRQDIPPAGHAGAGDHQHRSGRQPSHPPGNRP